MMMMRGHYINNCVNIILNYVDMCYTSVLKIYVGVKHEQEKK